MVFCNGIYEVETKIDDEINVGDEIVLVNSNCEFDFNCITGSFETTEASWVVDVEIVKQDLSNYIPEKSNNGGCYAFATAIVKEVL